MASLRSLELDLDTLPYTVKILLENALRHDVEDDVQVLAHYRGDAVPARELSFRPARVLLQDFTGVPALVDLAALRDAVAANGGDPARVEPVIPVELVIDHSVQVDAFGSADALTINAELEFARNRERYGFLRWGGRAFEGFVVAPPDAGIVHQINLEHLARVVFEAAGRPPLVYPDTVIGTDSHTPMVNGLGVLGWGVGGIEAEAAMLGQAISMRVPEVVGIELKNALPVGVTATDLVLTIAELLRKRGVVGKLVEFFGPSVRHVPLADRATIGNMSPEYGATCAVFPIDEVTLDYLRLTGRSADRVALVEAYAREQGLWLSPDARPAYSDVITLDLASIEPSLAGPRRPQDRVPLRMARERFLAELPTFKPGQPETAKEHTSTMIPWGEAPGPTARVDGGEGLRDGAVVLAAITSCTNTSNPSVMIAAGLLARNAAARGLRTAPWVKTSLAPGSLVVTDYLDAAGLTPHLETLGFHVVGYGCTTCIGNSGPLPEDVAEAITKDDLVVCSVLSGNRNFEGRIHSQIRANYLMSPPLVVAYAIAGRMDVDLHAEPLGRDAQGMPVFLRDVWPSDHEIAEVVSANVRAEMYGARYGNLLDGGARWQALEVREGRRFAWDESSTYIRRPPYFDDVPDTQADIRGARALLWLGDSVTTDHISPAGSIRASSPAGRWLGEHGVSPRDFNSYGARRGNHEVMVRGTFANGRIKNRLAPGTEGGVTTHFPTGEVLSVYDAAMRYRSEGTPLVVIAGREYGSGSSRDWAAKGPALLGVRAVIAESFERIHRTNLVGMGILPLQTKGTVELRGDEVFDLEGVAHAWEKGTVRVTARAADGTTQTFDCEARIDTREEAAQFRHGGILPYVLRRVLGRAETSEVLAAAGHQPVVEVFDDGKVEEGSIESFPASDSPAY